MIDLYMECSPDIHPQTINAIVAVESNFNPFAIGVVDGYVDQPKNKKEALDTISKLIQQGKNFSIGLAQINRFNIERWGLTFNDAIEPCKNLELAQKVLTDCYARAGKEKRNNKWQLLASFSCYYSNNFRFGFKNDFAGQPSYVEKVYNERNTSIPEFKLANIQEIEKQEFVSLSNIKPAQITVKAKKRTVSQPKISVRTVKLLSSVGS